MCIFQGGQRYDFFLCTGLPLGNLVMFVNFMKNSSPELKSLREILNSFQEFLLGLIRMRLK